MSDAFKAVFLSYASQDAEAARRVADALREAGVEVWFDADGGLEHGDEWDAKIRRQIKECVLFIAVISANTQAREEGYFRIEWELAAQRAMGIASGVAFLLPIVIDDTREQEALVPDRFRAVQWTRLKGGVVTPDVKARLLKLWSHRIGAVKARGGGDDTRAPAAEPDATESLPRRKPRKRVAIAVALLAAASIAAGYFALRPKIEGPSAAPASASAEAPRSEARHARFEPPIAQPQPASKPKVDPKSIAVLPFANLSGDQDNEFFSDGISEELGNVLGRVAGLRVAGRTSAFYFKGKQLPLKEIGRQLGVAYLVEGSVRKMGSRVRITAKLVNAADGFQVWASDNLDRESKDIFAVQDEIAGLIAKNLQLTLGASTRASRSVNPEALRLVFEGRHYWNLRGEANLALAETAYLRALELDPQFAQAQAGLADVWAIRAWYREMDRNGEGMARDLERAQQEAQRAREQDPTMAEPYASMGVIHFIGRRFAESEQEFTRGSQANPNYAVAHHWHSMLTVARGRIDRSLDQLREAVRLDPLSPNALWSLAAVANHVGLHAEAMRASEESLRIRPGFAPVLGEKALSAWALQRRDLAIATARELAASFALSPVRWWADSDAIYILREAGLGAEANAHLERVLAASPAGDHRRAGALAAAGRLGEAIDAMTRLPTVVIHRITYHAMWDPVREDPRFHAMLARLGFTEEYNVGRALQAQMRSRVNETGRPAQRE